MRTGGGLASMVRVWTALVWVRRRRSASNQKVSLGSIEGWCGAVLSAVKLLKRVSMSGPSATVKPRRWKIAEASSMTLLTGWMTPSARQRPGSVTSKPAVGSAAACAAVVFSARACSKAARQAPSSLPKAGRSAGGTSFICLTRPGMRPLRPRYFTRRASNAAASAAAATASSEAACSCCNS